MNVFLKKIILKVCFGNSFTRKNVVFGKDSYIREHAKISGGKYINLGNHTRILPYCRIECFDKISGENYSPCLQIGNNVLLGRNSTILCADRIEIGDDSLFASYIFISDENHGMDPEAGIRYEKQKLTTRSVKIGKNCWVGEKVIILPGTVIGDNCVIGAGSVVKGIFEANSMIVGSPGRVIRKYSFETHHWEKLENICGGCNGRKCDFS